MMSLETFVFGHLNHMYVLLWPIRFVGLSTNITFDYLTLYFQCNYQISVVNKDESTDLVERTIPSVLDITVSKNSQITPHIFSL